MTKKGFGWIIFLVLSIIEGLLIYGFTKDPLIGVFLLFYSMGYLVFIGIAGWDYFESLADDKYDTKRYIPGSIYNIEN